MMRRNVGARIVAAARRELRKEQGYSPVREFLYGDGFMALVMIVAAAAALALLLAVAGAW